MSDSTTASQKLTKQNEFEDGRVRAPYTWKQSFKDWFTQLWSSSYSDEKVESRLLSCLPFWPELDGTRHAQMINTDIGNGKFIHEFYVENKPSQSTEVASSLPVRDIVLVHGYAASLGLFFENFDALLSIPGVRLHAIDLPGFGFSSRPKFPNFKTDTKDDIFQTEDWFIDSLEEWRKRRGINQFILIGHSFGGYLSCAYALKYNKLVEKAAASTSGRLIDKLILLSPVGVERNKYSLLKNEKPPKEQVTNELLLKQNAQNEGVHVTDEVTANQESIVQGKTPEPLQRDPGEATSDIEDRMLDTFKWLWRKHISPFSLVRKMGPIRSKMISGWTSHRFAHIYQRDPQQYQNVHDYFYRIFNAAGSGEYAITRVLDIGALARLPLLDRCPEKFVEMKLPSLWLYGDKDWMNEVAGEEMTREINRVADARKEPKLAQFGIIPNAGHHLYLDNPKNFGDVVTRYILGK